MKIKLCALTSIIAISFCVTAQAGTTKALAITKKPPVHVDKKPAPALGPAGQKMIENFSQYADGKFPKWWKTWPFQRDKGHAVYKVKVDGGKHYLVAYDTQDYSAQIMKPFIWNTDEYPYLNWRWRPKVLPRGATEAQDDKNDSACGIYVIFGRYSGVASKYVWSTSLPAGQVVSRRGGDLRILSMGSGQGGVGKWHSYSVNVLQSAEKLFGKPMTRKPSGIAILTDGNATHTPAACDYADFVISQKPLY